MPLEEGFDIKAAFGCRVSGAGFRLGLRIWFDVEEVSGLGFRSWIGVSSASPERPGQTSRLYKSHPLHGLLM